MEVDVVTSVGTLRVMRYDHYKGRPTIVFLHDSLGCIALWRDFPKKLGDLTQCNVLVYDRQGYGRSCPFSQPERDLDYMEIEADVLQELLLKYSIEQAILFGHSDGGSIALVTASKYPEKIIGVLSEGAHIFVEEVTLQGIRDAIQLYQTSNLKVLLSKYHGDKTDAMFWAWGGIWTREKFRNWTIEHFLPGIHCPVLIIQGENDEYGTLKQVEGIAKLTSGPSGKFILPNTSHSPHKEQADTVLQKSAEFIREYLEGR